MRCKILLFTSMLALAALAFAAQRAQVFINGKETNEVLVSGGKTYVAVNALREAGALVTVESGRIDIQFEPVRGRLQGDMIEGRIDEWLSNGTWRVRVSNLEEIPNPFYGKGKGYALTIEIRNLTTRTQSFYISGFDKMLLLDDQENKLTFTSASFTQQYANIVQADGIKARVQFGDVNNAHTQVGRAEKLLILFRPSGNKPALKGFRILLSDSAATDTSETPAAP
ncbi:MAG: hypothetical protein RMM08_00215 [Armatimonadota bacterium]|nr:hypothetical protein [bacterium]MDW8319758.1 hypothetical protein [Armatimonadota bacterium]